MLSNREKQWAWIGGAVAFCLFYVWFVLFPLISYHDKMSQRIARSWKMMQKLEREIGIYARAALPIRILIRRATPVDQKHSAREQLTFLVRRVMGPQAGSLTFRFSTVWEGDQVTLYRCVLKGRTSPLRLIKLVQRIDRSYRPMRVASWCLEHIHGEMGTMKMEIYYLDEPKR